MPGFHPLDILILVVIGLAIFGPKGLQSIARNAGKGVGQAKEMKDKLMSELPTEELNKVSDHMARIPTSPQKAAKLLLTPDRQEEKVEKKAEAVSETNAVVEE